MELFDILNTDHFDYLIAHKIIKDHNFILQKVNDNFDNCRPSYNYICEKCGIRLFVGWRVFYKNRVIFGDKYDMIMTCKEEIIRSIIE